MINQQVLDKKLDAIKLFLLSLLFVFAPLYSRVNIGGTGLSLVYNISVWTVACWIMAVGLIFILRSGKIIFPNHWLVLSIFPCLVLISSTLAEINQPIDWLFRQLYIFGGLLFLLVLFQFRYKTLLIDKALALIIITGGCQSLLAMVQILEPTLFPSVWLYSPPDHVPRGSFQQVNVLASFLATGIVTTIYYISRPRFITSHFFEKVIVVILSSIMVYVVIASGSRIGLLSVLLAVPLVFFARRRQLKRHKKLLIILAVCYATATLLASSGLEKTIDKTAQLTENSYSTARIAMYTIGIEIIADEPIKGHGIGSFLLVWNKKASDFVNRHPETFLPDYITHPHNELLLWGIEGGVLAIIGILTFVIVVFIALYRCGFQRGGAYAAMLLPITLHTQVELPFYISSIHWFLWLFIIFLVLRHQTKEIGIHLSGAAKKLLYGVSLGFAVGITLFMINTARAQVDLYNYLYNKKNAKPPYLQVALNNLYFKPLAEEIAMRSMLYASIEQNDHKKVEIFEKWANDNVRHHPELKMYEDLISASMFLRPEGKGCDAIEAGLAMYAQNKPLQKAHIKCLKE